MYQWENSQQINHTSWIWLSVSNWVFSSNLSHMQMSQWGIVTHFSRHSKNVSKDVNFTYNPSS
jgi:hypothetical protein